MDTFLPWPFCGVFCYHRGNAWLFPSKSTIQVLWLFFHSITFVLVPKYIDSLKGKAKKTPFFLKKKRKTNSSHAGIQSKIYERVNGCNFIKNNENNVY